VARRDGRRDRVGLLARDIALFDGIVRGVTGGVDAGEALDATMRVAAA